jgi:AraC-like DNA-binding protein
VVFRGSKQGSFDIYDWLAKLQPQAAGITPDTISAILLVRILRAAIQEGYSRPALLAAIGVDDARLRNPLNRFSSQVALKFFAYLERQTGNPAIALTIGEKASMQNFSDLGYASRLGANLGAVIEANVALQMLFKTVYDPGAKPPTLVWQVPSDVITAYAPIVEFSVATFARLARQIVGEAPILYNVHFQHAPRFEPDLYDSAFGCKVHFNMEQTRMEIAARQLFRPSPHANAALLEAATNRYQRPVTWLMQNKQHAAHSYFYLSNEVDKSPPTLDRMAKSFGMTERSLRRKLVQEGHPFRELLDEVRQDLCTLYIMEDKRPLGKIALLLGYSDLSAFTRAYKRWHGAAPSKS